MSKYRNVYETPELFFHHAIDETPVQSDFQMHIHIHYEIYFFVSGSVHYLVENSEYALKPGNILLMRPMEYHMAKMMNDDRYERYCVIFSEELLDPIDPQRRLLLPFHSRPLEKANIFSPSEFPGVDPLELFKSIAEADSAPETKRTAVLANLYALLWELSKAYENKKIDKKSKSADSLTDQILRYMNKHLFDDITIESISEHFYISASYLHRLIKNAVGASAWKYILYKRLSAAQGEIQNGSTATDACRKCGFKDYSAFYRAYVKRYGVSPAGDSARTNQNKG
ncbi:MAG: AraC family transcriptional regulator [Clostridiales bacterium]|nr:AraC family transcriptional regulator [Clostridiales bacterium]